MLSFWREDWFPEEKETNKTKHYGEYRGSMSYTVIVEQFFSAVHKNQRTKNFYIGYGSKSKYENFNLSHVHPANVASDSV